MARCSAAVAAENKIRTWPKLVTTGVVLKQQHHFFNQRFNSRNAKKYEKKDVKGTGQDAAEKPIPPKKRKGGKTDEPEPAGGPPKKPKKKNHAKGKK